MGFYEKNDAILNKSADLKVLLGKFMATSLKLNIEYWICSARLRGFMDSKFVKL